MKDRWFKSCLLPLKINLYLKKTTINQLVGFLNNNLVLRKKFLNVPFSNEAFFMLQILYLENYLDFFFIKEKIIFFKIKYQGGNPIIKKIIFFSKKGQSQQISFNSFWNYFHFYQKQVIFSTTKKIQPDHILKKLKVGGSILFFIKILNMILKINLKKKKYFFIYFCVLNKKKYIVFYNKNFNQKHTVVAAKHCYFVKPCTDFLVIVLPFFFIKSNPLKKKKYSTIEFFYKNI